MPDIAMCNLSSCPKAQECYRFTVTPNPHWQSYFANNKPWPDCRHFMSNKEP
jgi:hypothetical protein